MAQDWKPVAHRDNCLCLATLRQRGLYLLIADVLYTCLKGQPYFKASQKNVTTLKLLKYNKLIELLFREASMSSFYALSTR